MFSYCACFSFILFFTPTTSLPFAESTTIKWLPKCCPEGKQISGDGKSCMNDVGVSLEYNVTDAGRDASADVLSITTSGNDTVQYTLEHKDEFSCVRHELYAIDDDLEVTVDGSVVVVDEDGDSWSLPRAEVCVDSVYLPPALGLSPDRVHVALLCPSCQRLTCLHKCCPQDHQLQVNDDASKVECIPASDDSWYHHFNKNSSNRPFVFHGFPECKHSLYLEYPESPLRISRHGHLELRGVTVPRVEYCTDTSARGLALLGCRQLPARRTLYGGLFCLGAVFLGLTLALHLWLPELRKTLHSRVLLAHVACLLVGYLGLAVVTLAPLPTPSTLCSVTALVIQFAILSSMFWLNIMCIDIAWTFSGVRAPKASTSLDSDGHKFLYYSLYAWGSTAAISGVTVFLEYSPAIPAASRLKPGFGASACWFQYWESVLLLVYGPMAVLLISNIILFVYTACKIQRTQKDTANLVQHAGSKLRENKDRFSLYLKLFGLMGITWVFEVVSWVVGGPDSYWYVTDTINAFRSIFIFALFCLKKKVLVLIKAKLSPDKAPKFPMYPRKSGSSSKMSSSMTSQRTNSIQLSQIS